MLHETISLCEIGAILSDLREEAAYDAGQEAVRLCPDEACPHGCLWGEIAAGCDDFVSAGARDTRLRPNPWEETTWKLP